MKKQQILEIPLKDIEVLENIRQSPVKEELSDLMTSIKQEGLLQPIGLKKQGKSYMLLWGYRRYKAFEKLGFKTIPSILFRNEIEVMNEIDFLVINSSENIHRKSVSAVELGRICHMLYQNYNLSRAEIAVRLSVPITRVKTVMDEFKKVPKKYRDKIRIFKSGSTERGGQAIPSSISKSILGLGTITPKEREDIYDWVLKEEKTATHILVLGRLIKGGMNLKHAKKEVDNWSSKGFQYAVNKKVYMDLGFQKSKNNFRKYLVELVNRDVKRKLIF